MTKIEGVPKGWEPYAIGPVNNGETYMSHYSLSVLIWNGSESEELYLKVRKTEPYCTWKHGVFTDGYVTQDQDGRQWFWSLQPSRGKGEWIGNGNFVCPLASTAVTFRDDLQWNERIQQVGPTIEATLRGDT